MLEDTTLIKKREELKRQLAAAEHKWLFGAMLDGTGRFIQKLTRNPELPAFWYNALVIVLVCWLISLLTSILLSEFYPLRRNAIPMDYHNRIKATRDSALDLRAALNFLNSLLLPLLAFLLANLGKVLEAFR